MSHSHAPRSRREYSDHNSTVRLRWRDGAWLNGRSKPWSAANIQPNNPSACGTWKLNLNGKRRDPVTERIWAASSRLPWVWSSSRVGQKSKERPYRRSVDQYGTIVHARKGMVCSHPKTSEGTWGRKPVNQFANR